MPPLLSSCVGEAALVLPRGDVIDGSKEMFLEEDGARGRWGTEKRERKKQGEVQRLRIGLRGAMMAGLLVEGRCS